MAETRFTPGPWSVGESSSGGGILRRGPGDGAPRADRHMQSHLQVFPLEDAHLIASAPDLYAALEAVRVWVALATAEHPGVHPQAIKNAEEDLVRLDAALAKARGDK